MPLQRLHRPARQFARSPALEARDVDLDARLGEREEVRAQAHVALVAEDRAREREQRALEVGERDVLVDREALDLVELRRVRRVAVRPVDAPGDDDRDRRRLLLHRADLHRRGVRAQYDLVRAAARLAVRGEDVERVRARARGVRRVVVERVEVVEDGLDLGALLDREAEAAEDVLDLAPRGGQQVQAPVRARAERRAASRRRGRSRGARSALRARARSRASRSATRAPDAPGWRPCRPRRAPPAAARRRRAAGSGARPCARGSGPAAPRARRSRSPPRSRTGPRC